MNKGPLWALVAVLAMALPACQKQIVAPGKGGRVSETMGCQVYQPHSFGYLKVRSKLDLDMGSRDISARAQIRLAEDSLFWMSVQSMGFEGMRILIRRDSVFILNRLKKTAMVGAFPQAGEKAENNEFPLRLEMAQTWVVGGMPFQAQDSTRYDTTEAGLCQIHHEAPQIRTRLVIDSAQHLKAAHLLQLPLENTLDLQFSDYRQVQTYTFPFRSKLKLDYLPDPNAKAQVMKMDMEVNDFEFATADMSFPFSIPGSYQVKPLMKAEKEEP